MAPREPVHEHVRQWRHGRVSAVRVEPRPVREPIRNRGHPPREFLVHPDRGPVRWNQELTYDDEKRKECESPPVEGHLVGTTQVLLEARNKRVSAVAISRDFDHRERRRLPERTIRVEA